LRRGTAPEVISRTSVEQFRDTKLSMKAIAEQLGVTKILEGGVQRGGDRVRINVQLIDAASDGHLWAETYDRELTPPTSSRYKASSPRPSPARCKPP
jgi:TolB-like protein